MRLRLAYITCADAKQARALARKLLEERLVACANLVPRTETLYWWKGKIESAKEALLFCKTTAKNAPKVIKRVRQLHTYEVPCVLVLKVEKGNPKYIEWLCKECR